MFHRLLSAFVSLFVDALTFFIDVHLCVSAWRSMFVDLLGGLGRMLVDFSRFETDVSCFVHTLGSIFY